MDGAAGIFRRVLPEPGITRTLVTVGFPYLLPTVATRTAHPTRLDYGPRLPVLGPIYLLPPTSGSVSLEKVHGRVADALDDARRLSRRGRSHRPVKNADYRHSVQQPFYGLWPSVH
jgi:hypothetical protein